MININPKFAIGKFYITILKIEDYENRKDCIP